MLWSVVPDWGMDLAGCGLLTRDFLWPQGAIPLGFYLLTGGYVYCLVPEVPLIREMPTGLKVFLAMLNAYGLRPCVRTYLKNGLVPNSLVQWGAWQIPSYILYIFPPAVRFIAWCLKRSSLGECRWGLRHFWSHWVCLDDGPVPGPTLKKALCHTHSFYDK